MRVFEVDLFVMMQHSASVYFLHVISGETPVECSSQGTRKPIAHRYEIHVKIKMKEF